LREGGVGGQFWSVYVDSAQPEPQAVVQTLDQLDLTLRMIDAYDQLALCRNADQVDSAIREGRIASLVGVEGGHSIGSSLGVLRILHAMGMRYLTLTHNNTTGWADSATDLPRNDGLAPFGRDVVRELNRLGVAVDLSHVAHRTMEIALETSAAPVIFSHSSAFVVTPHQRNVPDYILARLPQAGGVCMVNFLSKFVSPAVFAWDQEMNAAASAAGVPGSAPADALGTVNPVGGPELTAFAAHYATQVPRPTGTIDDVVAHCEHIREVAGIEHIGLGADYDGGDPFPTGLEDVAGYPRLLDALAARGWSAGDLTKLAGANVVRVLHEIEDVAR